MLNVFLGKVASFQFRAVTGMRNPSEILSETPFLEDISKRPLVVFKFSSKMSKNITKYTLYVLSVSRRPYGTTTPAFTLFTNTFSDTLERINTPSLMYQK